MALNVHLGSGPLALADELAELLANDPLDVFDTELVVVPTPGVERWLVQRLSHRLGSARGDDGVCAGLQAVSPHSFIAMLLGRDHDDPWHPDRLAWAVLRAMDECAGTPGFESLSRHIGADTPRPGEDSWFHSTRASRRFAVARRLARLFLSYCDERPEMMRSWEAGQDNAGEQVPPDLLWQAPLWRTTVRIVAERGLTDESPVARLDRVVEQLRQDSGLTLPGRVSLFGYTRISRSTMAVLDALAAAREVHLWLPHPSFELWRSLEGRPSAGLRREDVSARVAVHPLLATLGRDVRELEATLISANPRVRFTDEPPSTQPTLLHRLQADIRANTEPRPQPLAPDDQSLQIHSCHGPARQVEALRETLTWLVDAHGGGLQPRDIIVMCPDIETFAPLIKANFALADDATPRHPGQQVRVQLADRSLFATNAIIEAAGRLLELVSTRVTASQVLDFAALPAVSQKFGFDSESLDRISSWVSETEARWGLDTAHRQDYGLAAYSSNTWHQALDRLALGVAVSADSAMPAGEVLPVDDLGSGDIETASNFIRLLEALNTAAVAARARSKERPHLPERTFTPHEWFTWLRDSVLAVAAAPAEAAWQVAKFEREVGFLAQDADASTSLRLTDLRVMVAQRWAPGASRSNFRTGAVSICTMLPMRSVPHRAVIVLGLDDDVFPREYVRDGDDVLAREPHVGERDPRSEDRQLLLDAVMAARDYFIAFYSGFDERRGTSRPAAVPLQELASAARSTSAPETPFVVREHALQAFDSRNFADDSPLPGGSYDRSARQGAQTLRRVHADPASAVQPHGVVEAPLSTVPAQDVSLSELTDFLTNPARTFLRNRLDITVPREVDDVDDAIPIELDTLETWSVGDRMLRAVLDGATPAVAYEREERRGALPPAGLGGGGEQIRDTVEAIVSGLPQGQRRSLDIGIDIQLPPADDLPSQVIRATGVVSGLVGDELQVLTYSKVNAKHLAQAWVQLLALAVAYPETAWRAAIRGRGQPTMMRAPNAERALAELRALVVQRREGLRAPLPAPVKTAHAFAEAYRAQLQQSPNDDATAVRAGHAAAAKQWESRGGNSNRIPGEKEDHWWQRANEGLMSYADFSASGELSDRALHLWLPILDHRQETRA